MTPTSHGEAVFVEAAGRIHFGVLDLRGTLGRWFGSIGAAVSTPTLLVSATRAEELEVSGEDVDRAQAFARRVLDRNNVDGGARLCVHRSLPPHVGLGSGTQLALAVGRALSELYGLGIEPAELARTVGRAHRSAIGTYAFAGGGLVVDGGKRIGSLEIAPLLARMPIPPAWWCVIGIPDTGPGISGDAETEVFAQLPAPPEREVERVAHLVLMGLLPSLADADLVRFGEALSAIESITGYWFRSVQGGMFASSASEDLVRSIKSWGALGVGQSSWGPAVYGIVDGEEAGRRLARRVRADLGDSGAVYEGPFRVDGARVWRGDLERTRPAVQVRPQHSGR